MKPKFLLITLLSLLMLSSCNFFKKHRLFSKDVDSVLDMTIEEPETVAEDTTDYYAEEEYIEPVIESDPQPVYSSSGDRYLMIVGSFQNKNLATLYADKIQNLGYESEIVEASNGFYRVSARSYTNFNDGISEIAEFRNSLTAGAWLHVRN